MIARASKMIPTLPARQVECEESGNVPEDINNELIRAGFYRIVQPRRFGGYEFDIPTFYRVMIEISRGCSETNWLIAFARKDDFRLFHIFQLRCSWNELTRAKHNNVPMSNKLVTVRSVAG
jgi:Acyl-CoA dehydrogenase, N-terminal domain